jgi:heme-degrading monooxygenase HmoA
LPTSSTKFRLGVTLLLGSLLLLGSPPSIASPSASKAGPVHQLRIYEIFDNNKAAFHARFRDHAARIMKRHGYKIISMWETKHEGRTEFVYLLVWPNEQVMQAAWAAFMADKEWSDIKRLSAGEHGQMVGRIEDRTLRLTDYSPALQAP